MVKFYIVSFLLLFNFLAMSQNAVNADSVIEAVKYLDNDNEITEKTDLLISELYILPIPQARELSAKILDEARSMNNKTLYILALIHSYRLNDYNSNIVNLNKAVALASADEKPKLLAAAYTFKAIIFRDNGIYDSAMTYALMAQDLIEEMNDDESKTGILQLIADMHFHAGEYENAEKLYIRIQAEEPGHYDRFNYRIIQNNLGLIKIKQKKYAEAELHFKNSLGHFAKIKANHADSSGIPYLFRKFMELYILMGDYARAESYFENGYKLSRYFNQDTEKAGLLIGKSKLLLHQGKIDSALKVIREAEIWENKFPDLGYKTEINKILAEIYRNLRDFEKANEFLSMYSDLMVKQDSISNRARLMHIYAAHNYAIALRQLDNYKLQRNLSAIIAVLVFMGLIVNSVYFVRIRRKNRMLMEKNLQLAYKNEVIPFNTGKSAEAEPSYDPAEEQTETFKTESDKKQREPGEKVLSMITERLNEMIENEKVYLDSDLTLSILAEKLSTNKTYLLKAIQKKYNMNFLDFINGYRINEAIRIIDSEEGKNLSIEGIATLSGFSNRVTFSKIFKDATGVSPAYFIKNLDSIRDAEWKKVTSA